MKAHHKILSLFLLLLFGVMSIHDAIPHVHDNETHHHKHAHSLDQPHHHHENHHHHDHSHDDDSKEENEHAGFLGCLFPNHTHSFRLHHIYAEYSFSKKTVVEDEKQETEKLIAYSSIVNKSLPIIFSPPFHFRKRFNANLPPPQPSLRAPPYRSQSFI